MLCFVNCYVTACKSAWQKLPQASFRTWRNKKFMNKKITIRPEEHKDYKSIISLILRSFQEGTDYSECTDFAGWPESLISYNWNTDCFKINSVAGWPESLISYNYINSLQNFTCVAGWPKNLISYNIMLEKQIPVDVAGWSESLISYNYC